jgi:hypothetical protein
MANTRPRSGREKSEDHLADMVDDGFLKKKHAYNKFLAFLDFKDESVFSAFRRRLESFADQQDFKWGDMDGDESKARDACAQCFLSQFGKEYWGDDADKREKYLTPSEGPEDNFKWPKDRDP